MSVLKPYGAGGGPVPSNTWRIANGRISGSIDGMQAVRQAAELALSIERFRHPIYSGDYGAELGSLVGKRRGYVETELRRRIEEALKEDDRVEGIRDFAVEFQGGAARVRFRVVSALGDFDMERGVTIGG